MLAKNLIVVVLMGAALTLAPSRSWAQPDVEAAPVAPNPPNVQVVPQTPEQKQQAIQQATAKMKAIMDMTPVQQKAMMKNLQDQSLRAQLTRMGVTDAKAQTAIFDCIAAQETERDKVRVAASKVYKLTLVKAAPDADTNLNQLLNGYLAAVDDAKAQREVAANALDAQIGWSKKPQLEAFLSILGVIGDAAWYTGDVQSLGSLSLASLAMMAAGVN